MIFTTKAETLERLKNQVEKSTILPQIRFLVIDWKNKKKVILEKIRENIWDNKDLIVRSSAISEDNEQDSMAGKFLSIDNVKGINNIIDAVESVINSFTDNNDENQIFIQPMLKNIKICGVAFTCDPNNGGNYYIINYDDSGSTSSITSGNSIDSSTYYIFKDIKDTNMFDKTIKDVLEALKEIELIFSMENLDIEFAVDDRNKVYIFQVRPLILKQNIKDLKVQKEILQRIECKINNMNNRKPNLYGESTIFGVMPDWNPAEIIGIHPKPLALSLYKEIITDSVWAYQRDNYGYLNLRSNPLLIDFAGMPYIDVRVSFNSFLPKGLSEELSEKLVDYYLNRLKEDPSKHDKVEFDIIFSCYTFDLLERIKVLSKYGFNNEEIDQIVTKLKYLTNKIINSRNGLWKKDSDKIKILEKKHKEVIDSDLDDISKIYWLLENCKRYGTLPFAGLARAGFIAVQMLKSLVDINILNDIEYNEFMKSLNTVSSSIKYDFDKMSKNEFLCKYGHLRPGTYDIKSRRYDEAPDIYFNWNNKKDTNESSKHVFKMSLEQLKTIKDTLIEHGIEDDVLLYFDFIKEAIEGREYSKFIFTKCISDVLVLMKNVGQKYNFSEEEISFCNIDIIRKLYSSEMSIKDLLKQSIEEGRKRYLESLSIIMPTVIFSSKDIFNFKTFAFEPNFITLKTVSAKKCINLEDVSELNDSILLIEAADPGYDWIFSYNIKGFITAYGGVNSHMAIRAGEMQIPAVIGVGQKMFDTLKEAEYLEIDASAKKVSILR